MIRLAISAAAVVLALAAAGAAGAEEGAMRVRLGDLDLQSDQGARAALTRIRNASTSFCSGDGSARDLHEIVQQQHCARRMTAKAVDLLDAPKVTALSGRGPARVELSAVTR